MLRQAWRAGHLGRAGWMLATSFDEQFIRDIKRLPKSDRAWIPAADGKGGVWWVAVEHETALAELLPGFAAYLLQGQLL